MDKRYAQMSPAEQVERRREVLSHIQARPELSVDQVVSLLRGELRFTLSEYSRLTGVSARVIQDIEQAIDQVTPCPPVNDHDAMLLQQYLKKLLRHPRS